MIMTDHYREHDTASLHCEEVDCFKYLGLQVAAEWQLTQSQTILTLDLVRISSGEAAITPF